MRKPTSDSNPLRTHCGLGASAGAALAMLAAVRGCWGPWGPLSKGQRSKGWLSSAATICKAGRRQFH